jgi:UDP-N-acetylglucosamine:LPS N-acetylglucosamine transferase
VLIGGVDSETDGRGGAVKQRAVILSGSLGLGHEVMSEVLSAALTDLGWEVRVLDSMRLLGPIAGSAGERVFRRMTASPGVYDALHFSHLRGASRLAAAMDRAARAKLVPALRAELARQPAELILSVFSTGASAVAQLKAERADLRAVVLCTDASLYAGWVQRATDLFLVTSQAAAASVRRYAPRARIAIVPPPVRAPFYDAPPQAHARSLLGLPTDGPCVLMMGGGWGLGPLWETARTLSAAGVHVLAVAGHNQRLADRLRDLGLEQPRVHPFGFTEQVPVLMAAADVVLSTPGATTLSEARVVGRPLALLDVIPGHGRENLQHELEVGNAQACSANPAMVTESLLAMLEHVERPLPAGTRRAGEFTDAFTDALALIGLVPNRRLGERIPGTEALQAAR